MTQSGGTVKQARICSVCKVLVGHIVSQPGERFDEWVPTAVCAASLGTEYRCITHAQSGRTDA